MSRSSPPRSSIAASLRQKSESHLPSKPPARPLKRRLNIKLAKFSRWLHIYLSMFSLAVVLFFSVTGITLNHPDWFFSGAESNREAEGEVSSKWLHLKAPAQEPAANPAEAGTEADRQVSKLEIVEHLRKTHKIPGALADFRVDDAECVISFKGPGYAADAFIDRESGHYRLTETYHGFIAVINDLHKGRDTGPVWSILIDVSAVLMTLISLTGLVLLFYLKLRRVPGLIVALAGTIVAVLLYRLGVP
jgi:uncharacterized protein